MTKRDAASLLIPTRCKMPHHRMGASERKVGRLYDGVMGKTRSQKAPGCGETLVARLGAHHHRHQRQAVAGGRSRQTKSRAPGGSGLEPIGALVERTSLFVLTQRVLPPVSSSIHPSVPVSLRWDSYR